MLVYGFCLPDKYRKEFKPPRGIVLSNKPQENIAYLKKIAKVKNIVSIGDVVTYNMILAGFKPSIAVVDYKTLRKEKIDIDFKKYFNKHVVIVNPPAMISSHALKTIGSLSNNTLVEVLGEEDLLLLPFLLMQQYNGYLLVYGQPDRGMVVVENNDITRKTAINFWILLKPCIKQESWEEEQRI